MCCLTAKVDELKCKFALLCKANNNVQNTRNRGLNAKLARDVNMIAHLITTIEDQRKNSKRLIMRIT